MLLSIGYSLDLLISSFLMIFDLFCNLFYGSADFLSTTTRLLFCWTDFFWDSIWLWLPFFFFWDNKDWRFPFLITRDCDRLPLERDFSNEGLSIDLFLSLGLFLFSILDFDRLEPNFLLDLFWLMLRLLLRFILFGLALILLRFLLDPLGLKLRLLFCSLLLPFFCWCFDLYGLRLRLRFLRA